MPAKRTKARERALQALYQIDVAAEGIDEALARFWRSFEPVEREVQALAEELVRGVAGAPARDRRGDRARLHQLAARPHGQGGPERAAARRLRAACDRRAGEGRHQRGHRARQEVRLREHAARSSTACSTRSRPGFRRAAGPACRPSRRSRETCRSRSRWRSWGCGDRRARRRRARGVRRPGAAAPGARRVRRLAAVRRDLPGDPKRPLRRARGRGAAAAVRRPDRARCGSSASGSRRSPWRPTRSSTRRAPAARRSRARGARRSRRAMPPLAGGDAALAARLWLEASLVRPARRQILLGEARALQRELAAARNVIGGGGRRARAPVAGRDAAPSAAPCRTCPAPWCGEQRSRARRRSPTSSPRRRRSIDRSAAS